MGARACREPAHEHSGGVPLQLGPRWVASFRVDGPVRHGGASRRFAGRISWIPSPAVMEIRLAEARDAEAVRTIYNLEVTTATSTFDLVPRSLAQQEQWLAQRSGAFSAIVAELDGTVVGFASLSPYKERAAYRTTVEDSIYVSRDHSRRGIGTALLEHLIEIATASGFHTVIARIEASSDSSRALHTRCGFELVGIERQVGRKFNRWLDVAVLQRML